MNENYINKLLRKYNFKIKFEEDEIKLYTKTNSIILAMNIEGYYTGRFLTLLSVILGIKPAYYTVSSDNHITHINKKKLYEFGVKYKIIDKKTSNKIYLFYNNKISINPKYFDNIFLNVCSNHIEIGKILGIPDFAIDFFIKETEKYKNENSIGFHKHGFSFAIDKKDYKKAEKYIEKYKLPKVFYNI